MHDYIVFFGDNSIRITDQRSVNRDKNSDFYLFEPPFDWNTIINLALNSEQNTTITIQTSDISDEWNSFKSNFNSIKAAGGLVYNEFGELLIIDRLEKWDLPKGKIEGDETPEEAAMREVEEECGIDQLQINRYYGSTYQVYTLECKLILKQNIWYQMITNKQELIPQTSEGIANAFWIPETEIPQLIKKTYRSIAAFLEGR